MSLSRFLNKNNIKRYLKAIEKINTLTAQYEERIASDKEFSVAQTFQTVKDSSLAEKQKIYEAMALCRVAAFQSIQQKHYDVQIMGALALIDGKIAQMKTGEGKTLMCSAAVAANYMLGKTTHVATANEYLAQRDAQTLQPVYEALGISVAHNIAQMPQPEKKAAYLAGVMYSTAQEMGFDYLRDNLVKTAEEKIQPSSFDTVNAVIDEADFILIDEARTPLIISGNDRTLEAVFYNQIKEIALGLERMAEEPKKNPLNMNQMIVPKGHFWIDERQRAIHLSDDGYHRVEEALMAANLLATPTNTQTTGHWLYDRKNLWLIEEVLNALKAQYLFIRDKQYVVRNDEIVIIDENTGRLSEGRSWSDGLHQAVEAKEGVRINPLTTTVGTISIQNYFRLYGNISGMTGTALNASEEFEQIYSTQVVEIPTNKKMIRLDAPDVVYMRAQEKYAAIVAEIAQRHAKGQPLLLGTTSVQESEIISALLVEKQIPHNVLNAKNHALEAQIIAQAGVPGAVTVSTSMAGRGTDIILGGNVEEIRSVKFQQIQSLEHIVGVIDELIKNRQEVGDMLSSGTPEAQETMELAAQELKAHVARNDIQSSFYLQTYIEKYHTPEHIMALDLFELLNEKNLLIEVIDALHIHVQDTVRDWSTLREAALVAGGLCVIGCSRNESRRIDDQLRGRAGRQGDKGESVFFLSFEDQWLRVFGQSSMFKILQKNFNPEQPIQAPMIARSIEKAQRAIEGIHFDNRKNVFQFDSVLDESRRYFFKLRDSIIQTPEVLRASLAASIRRKMERLNDWEYLQTQHVEYKGESMALDILTEKLYEEKLERSEQTAITELLLATLLECKLESAKTLFQIIEYNDYWRRFEEGQFKTDAAFQKFLSKYVLNYFSHMTPDFWQWFNHFSIDTLDEAWLDYLHITEEIRQNSSLHSLAQKNPLYEYKKSCFSLFANIIETFEASWIDSIFDKIFLNLNNDQNLTLSGEDPAVVEQISVSQTAVLSPTNLQPIQIPLPLPPTVAPKDFRTQQIYKVAYTVRPLNAANILAQIPSALISQPQNDALVLSSSPSTFFEERPTDLVISQLDEVKAGYVSANEDSVEAKPSLNAVENLAPSMKEELSPTTSLLTQRVEHKGATAQEKEDKDITSDSKALLHSMEEIVLDEPPVSPEEVSAIEKAYLKQIQALEASAGEHTDDSVSKEALEAPLLVSIDTAANQEKFTQ